MNKIKTGLLLLGLTVFLAACGTQGQTGQTQDPAATEGVTETATVTETAPDEATESTETTETASADTTETTETAGAETETPAPESGRITNYEVDFSDVDGIRTMTAGEVDDDLLVLGVISNEDEEEQEIAVFRVENGQKNLLFTFFVAQPVELIGAVTGDDDALHFTAVNRTDENVAGSFTVYRVDLDDEEVHTIYQGEADELNYGHNLAADDNTVFFTEGMREEDGLYFADVVMVKEDAKHIVNVEVFPSGHVSLLISDDTLLYAAARDDEQYIIAYDYENDAEAKEFRVAGDNSNFRITDVDNGIYLLDNYNGHPEMRNAMILRVDAASGAVEAFSREGSSVHSAVFADRDDPEPDAIVAAASSGTDILWVEAEPGTGLLREIAGDVSVPEGSALTGVFEEDDQVIRYPKPVSPLHYGNFRLIYQVYR